MKYIVSILTLLLVLTGTAHASTGDPISPQRQILEDASFVLEEIINAPDEGIPSNLISKARAMVIIPTMVKGGFFVGARYGKGVVAIRDPKTGLWGPPSFFTTFGGSFGLQIGAQTVDLVLLVMSERGVKSLMNNKFTLGGDLAVSIGPVGRYAEAGTDITFQGEIYSYSRSKGAFAGVSLKGAFLQPHEEYNKEYYRTDLTAHQIMTHGMLEKLPKSSTLFVDNLNRLAPPARETLSKLHHLTTAEMTAIAQGVETEMALVNFESMESEENLEVVPQENIEPNPHAATELPPTGEAELNPTPTPLW